jgi:predicted nucleic acid-binding protein
VTARHLGGLGDTSILIFLERLTADQLPAELLISAVSLAELSAGVRSAQDAAERSQRILRLQRVEATFSPLPFDVEAARHCGVIAAGVVKRPQASRTRRRSDDRKHRRCEEAAAVHHESGGPRVPFHSG